MRLGVGRQQLAAQQFVTIGEVMSAEGGGGGGAQGQKKRKRGGGAG